MCYVSDLFHHVQSMDTAQMGPGHSTMTTLNHHGCVLTGDCLIVTPTLSEFSNRRFASYCKPQLRHSAYRPLISKRPAMRNFSGTLLDRTCQPPAFRSLDSRHADLNQASINHALQCILEALAEGAEPPSKLVLRRDESGEFALCVVRDARLAPRHLERELGPLSFGNGVIRIVFGVASQQCLHLKAVLHSQRS